jgi:hypothetical protein
MEGGGFLSSITSFMNRSNPITNQNNNNNANNDKNKSNNNNTPHNSKTMLHF